MKTINEAQTSNLLDLSDSDLDTVNGGYGERTAACLAGAALGAEAGPLGMLLGCAAGVSVLTLLK